MQGVLLPIDGYRVALESDGHVGNFKRQLSLAKGEGAGLSSDGAVAKRARIEPSIQLESISSQDILRDCILAFGQLPAGDQVQLSQWRLAIENLGGRLVWWCHMMKGYKYGPSLIVFLLSTVHLRVVDSYSSLCTHYVAATQVLYLPRECNTVFYRKVTLVGLIFLPAENFPRRMPIFNLPAASKKRLYPLTG